MNAQQVAERSAVYALDDAVAPVAGEAFDLLATAPQGVAKLRELILSLAVCGKLVAQRQADEPASVLVQQLNQEKVRLSKTGEVKRAKPSSPIGDDELAHELPPGWHRLRLGDIVSRIGAGSTPLGGRQVYTASGVKFLRSQNVWNSGLVLDGVAYIPQSVHERMAATKVIAGDLLFNITGASIGRCSLVPDYFDEANVSQHVTIVRPVLASIRQFLHLVLTSPYIQKTVMDMQVGVSREGLSIGKLSRFVIPLPPLAEQRRIVARVEELMGLCDELEARGRLRDEQHARLVTTLFDALVASTSPEELAENWQRIAHHFDLLLDRPEAVDALEQTILQLAVHGLLVPQDPADEPASELVVRIRAEKAQLIADGELSEKKLRDSEDHSSMIDLPHGWVSSSLAEIGIVNPRNTAQDDSIASFIPMNCVPIGLLDTHASEQRRWSEIKTGFTHFGEGDVGVAKITPCFENGKSTVFRNLTNGIGAGTTELHIVRPLGGVLPDYLLLFVKSPYFLRGGEAVMTGTAGQKRLPRSYFEGVPFPLPPIPEQGRIVARVKLLLTLCADLRQHLQQAQATQLNLADVLVARATA